MTPGPLEQTAPSSALVQGARVMRERRWVILLATLVGLGIALGTSLTAEKQYSATATLLIQQSSLPGLIDATVLQAGDEPERVQSTAIELATSQAVADRVRRRLRSTADAGSLADQVSAVAERDTNLIRLTAVDPSPRRAAALANAFAQSFAAFRRESQQQAVEEGERLIRSQLAELPPEASAERATLSTALARVTALRVVTTGDVEVVDAAGIPAQPSSPLPKRDAALGLVLGLALGLGLAFLIDLFDRRLKTPEDLEEAYGIRALATVPLRRRGPRDVRERQAELEPFRILRNGLPFLRPEGVTVVVVTSAVPGEGKTTVAAGMARAAVLSGASVVLVEADMRRPTLRRLFGVEGGLRGLSTALVDGADATDLLVQPIPALRTLRLLPSGPLPPNSAELLRSHQMGRLIEQLRADHDLVILDAPPLLPVADTQVLLDSTGVDAVLLVGRSYVTTRDQARRARHVIDRHGIAARGLVVNAVRDADASYDYDYASSIDNNGAGSRGARETTTA